MTDQLEKTKTTDTTEAPETDNEQKKSIKGKVIFFLVLALILAGGAATGFFFINRSISYLTTDNARVTTDVLRISSNIPGNLERFTIQEGQYVSANEVLGWVENGEAMRSPVNGLVIDTSVRQGQHVPAMTPIAAIADTDRLHIQANIRETDILQLEMGQRAYVTIDGLGNRQFTGYIADIGRITQAELSGQALFFNTGGNFTRITHLIPVEINIIDDVNLDNLIGVNARVRIPLRR